ncbi:uncharacterized protein LOC144138435 [Haemaphysalis longicornis]
MRADETAAAELHHDVVPPRVPSPGSSSETRSSTASTASSSTEEEDEAGAAVISSGVDLPYPGFVPVALYYFRQDRAPRSWCLRLVANPYPCLLSHVDPPSVPPSLPPTHRDSDVLASCGEPTNPRPGARRSMGAFLEVHSGRALTGGAAGGGGGGGRGTICHSVRSYMFAAVMSHLSSKPTCSLVGYARQA